MSRSSNVPGDLGVNPPVAESSSSIAPLVIVSERGRHDQASRRLVRAQAARASAAQSRITRAKNREEREARDGSRSTNVVDSPGTERSSASHSRSPPIRSPQSPLYSWLSATGGLPNNLERWHIESSTAIKGWPPLLLGATPSPTLTSQATLVGVRTLPLAVPRGFTDLAQRIELSRDFLTLVSRTACFDFVSPGVEIRLSQLITDQIVSTANFACIGLASQAPLLQRNLTLACTCISMFQSLQSRQQAAAVNPKYMVGLSAAWAEVVAIDPITFRDPNARNASLWCVIIICVTTRATGEPGIFYGLLGDLLLDLNISSWDQLRSVLLDFIYPGTTLDEPCRRFFEEIRAVSPG